MALLEHACGGDVTALFFAGISREGAKAPRCWVSPSINPAVLSKAPSFGRRRQVVGPGGRVAKMGCGLVFVILCFLEFWNPRRALDSTFHKSLSLSHLLRGRPEKPARIANSMFQKCSNSRRRIFMGNVPKFNSSAAAVGCQKSIPRLSSLSKNPGDCCEGDQGDTMHG
jgi:hypothetical protein